MTRLRVTRGHGRLETYLAIKRAEKAQSLLANVPTHGILLDIGCGHFPFFLMSSRFQYRIGVEKQFGNISPLGTEKTRLLLIQMDLEKNPILPFQNDSIDVVTMLAFLEHVEAHCALQILRESNRVLVNGGIIVLTTPNAWTKPVLCSLAKLRMVSMEEIGEHKTYFTPNRIKEILLEADFQAGSIQCGTFELGCNIWATARK